MKEFFLFYLCYLLISLGYSKVLPIAHRGASGYAPENTIESIVIAQELGAKYIEFDVHMTKDYEIVVTHDTTIDRTSDGEGEVFSYTLNELKTKDFGSWFSDKYKQVRIPTLREVLKLMGKNDVFIIEFKNGSTDYPQFEEKVIEIVREVGKESQVVLKTFNMKRLERFEEIAPDIKRLYCTFFAGHWFTLDDFIHFRGVFDRGSFQYLQVHKYFLSQNLIDKAHEKGIRVVVWDVHDKKTMKKFADMNVDFIESNRPDLVLLTK